MVRHLFYITTHNFIRKVCKHSRKLESILSNIISLYDYQNKNIRYNEMKTIISLFKRGNIRRRFASQISAVFTQGFSRHFFWDIWPGLCGPPAVTQPKI